MYLLVCTTRLEELERPDATYVKFNPIQYSEAPLSPQLSTSQKHHVFFFHDPTLIILRGIIEEDHIVLNDSTERINNSET